MRKVIKVLLRGEKKRTKHKKVPKEKGTGEKNREKESLRNITTKGKTPDSWSYYSG